MTEEQKNLLETIDSNKSTLMDLLRDLGHGANPDDIALYLECDIEEIEKKVKQLKSYVKIFKELL